MILLTANQKSAQLAFQTWCNCHLSSESLDKEVWSILISCSVVGRARRFRNFRLLARVWRRQSLYLHGRSSRSYLLLDGLHGVLQFVRDMHHERGRRHQPWCHSFLDGVMWNEPRWSWWNLQGSPAVFTIVLVKLAGSPAVFMSRVRRAFASDVPVADGRKPRIALALETFRVKRPRQRWGIEPVHVFPGGPGTVLVKKTTIFFKMSFSLQRNAHLHELNLAKFSRENLAKFAFREGFGHFWLDQFDRSYLCFSKQALQRWKVEMVFCWIWACRFTYRHSQHFTYRRRS